MTEDELHEKAIEAFDAHMGCRSHDAEREGLGIVIRMALEAVALDVGQLDLRRALEMGESGGPSNDYHAGYNLGEAAAYRVVLDLVRALMPDTEETK